MAEGSHEILDSSVTRDTATLRTSSFHLAKFDFINFPKTNRWLLFQRESTEKNDPKGRCLSTKGTRGNKVNTTATNDTAATPVVKKAILVQTRNGCTARNQMISEDNRGVDSKGIYESFCERNSRWCNHIKLQDSVICPRFPPRIKGGLRCWYIWGCKLVGHSWKMRRYLSEGHETCEASLWTMLHWTTDH